MSSADRFRWSQQPLYGTRYPKWTVEPSHAAITELLRAELKLGGCQQLDIAFLAEGSFNKVYKVCTNEQAFALRISLPLFAPLKVDSEVATSRFIRDLSHVPVPKVHAFDPTYDNPIGFPWILMDFVTGETARVAWRYLQDDQKEHFVRQLALVHSRLFDHQFQTIGSLRHKSVPTTHTGRLCRAAIMITFSVIFGIACCPGLTAVTIGVWLASAVLAHSTRNVAHDVQRDVTHDVEVGMLIDHRSIQSNPLPAFANTNQWLSHRLSNYSSDPDGDLKFAARLSSVVPLLYGVGEEESTMIWPRDLHADNIMVDRRGNITGLLDWEFTSTVPVWKACQPPEFFDPGRQDKKDEAPQLDGPDDQPDDDFYEDIREWEMKIRYRGLFLEMMAELQPHWAAIHNAAEVEREFEEAISEFEIGWAGESTDLEWIEQVEAAVKLRGPFDARSPKPLLGVESRDADLL